MRVRGPERAARVPRYARGRLLPCGRDFSPDATRSPGSYDGVTMWRRPGSIAHARARSGARSSGSVLRPKATAPLWEGLQSRRDTLAGVLRRCDDVATSRLDRACACEVRSAQLGFRATPEGDRSPVGGTSVPTRHARRVPDPDQMVASATVASRRSCGKVAAVSSLTTPRSFTSARRAWRWWPAAVVRPVTESRKESRLDYPRAVPALRR